MLYRNGHICSNRVWRTNAVVMMHHSQNIYIQYVQNIIFQSFPALYKPLLKSPQYLPSPTRILVHLLIWMWPQAHHANIYFIYLYMYVCTYIHISMTLSFPWLSLYISSVLMLNHPQHLQFFFCSPFLLGGPVDQWQTTLFRRQVTGCLISPKLHMQLRQLRYFDCLKVLLSERIYPNYSPWLCISWPQSELRSEPLS